MRRLALLLLFLPVPAAAETRDFVVTAFDRIRVDGDFDVTVTEGRTPAVRAEGDRRGLQRVAMRVEGDTLIIGTNASDWGGWPDAPAALPRIGVAARLLRGAQLNGAGTLAIAHLAGERIDIGVNGTGTMTVASATGTALEATVAGTGTLTLAGTVARAGFHTILDPILDAGGLDARIVTFVSESARDSHVRATGNARVIALGKGVVHVAGGADCAVSGPGDVECSGKRVRE